MKKILEIKHLNYNYDDNRVLIDINCDIYEKDFLAITGQNGAGKSTLLKLILGELSLKTGSIKLLGQDVSQFKQWSKIGYVPQVNFLNNSFFPASVSEVVGANLYSMEKKSKLSLTEKKQLIKKALFKIGMEEHYNTLIHHLSGGQKQRVLLAKVLVCQPDIIFLDEPTTGIDHETTIDFYKLLTKLNQEDGLTIVMVTHDIVNSANIVSRTLCIENCSMLEINKSQLFKEISTKHIHH